MHRQCFSESLVRILHEAKLNKTLGNDKISSPNLCSFKEASVLLPWLKVKQVKLQFTFFHSHLFIVLAKPHTIHEDTLGEKQ